MFMNKTNKSEKTFVSCIAMTKKSVIFTKSFYEIFFTSIVISIF